MSKWTHDELCEIAERWLKNSMRCGATISEITSHCGEVPDAIGWKSFDSFLIECKTSRADFHKDKKKVWRQPGVNGLGRIRYYMAPEGVLKPEDMPEGWGLLEVYGNKPCVRVVRGVKPAQIVSLQSEFLHKDNRDWGGEIILLVSALRRMQECQ